MEKKEVKQQSSSYSIELLVRASVAEYNTWWVYNYLEMDLLVKLLKGRRSNQPRDISFENKVLWALVHSNEDYREVKADQSRHHELISLFLTKYNRGDQDILDSKRGESAKFPRALRGLLISLAGHLEAKTKFPCLLQMDSDATSHMLPFLTIKEQVSLFSTCKALHENSGLIKPNKLLYLVARGEQDKAEVMIKKNPQLLLQSANITDGAGRYFKHITALQYAVWALDAHMWTMMLPYFGRHHPRDAVVSQLTMLEEKGTAHGHHFDFSPLLTAYQVLIDNYQPWSWDQVYTHWCQVIGGAQRLLPDHVVQEYTTPDRPFCPIPNFCVGSGRPAPHERRGVQWWRSARGVINAHNGGRLGEEWAVARAAFSPPASIPPNGTTGSIEPLNPLALIMLCRADQAAVTALCGQRASDLSELLSCYGVEGALAPERKSPGWR